jgi:hypothetical protein
MQCLCASKPKYSGPSEAEKKQLFTPTSLIKVTDEMMVDLRNQAQALFKEHRDRILAFNTMCLDDANRKYYADAGVYIKQNRSTPLVLVVSGDGNRALDIALLQTEQFLFGKIGYHAQLIPDSRNVPKINKRLKQQFWEHWPEG